MSRPRLRPRAAGWCPGSVATSVRYFYAFLGKWGNPECGGSSTIHHGPRHLRALPWRSGHEHRVDPARAGGPAICLPHRGGTTDRAGADLATAGDADGDGYGDFWTSAAGAVYLATGPVMGAETLSDASAVLWPVDTIRSIAGGQDVDGDGSANLVLVDSDIGREGESLLLLQ